MILQAQAQICLPQLRYVSPVQGRSSGTRGWLLTFGVFLAQSEEFINVFLAKGLLNSDCASLNTSVFAARAVLEVYVPLQRKGTPNR